MLGVQRLRVQGLGVKGLGVHGTPESLIVKVAFSTIRMHVPRQYPIVRKSTSCRSSALSC